MGVIMSTYYGGRSEVRIRRQIARVLYCDFLSMYPTVCTLMKLWRFVIAQRVGWCNATVATRRRLERVDVEGLRKPMAWETLSTLVQVEPDKSIFPVRARYNGTQHTTGLNCLSSQEPLWYTLADCIACKLLTGQLPKVLQAIHFFPIGIQNGLTSVTIAGNPAYVVDPNKDDFYKKLIELRNEERTATKDGLQVETEESDDAQQAIKILANATSYGIFMERNVTEQKSRKQIRCFGPSGEPFTALVKNLETSGRFFHPLLGTLITGGARLMLAIAEHLADQNAIGWAFCDTDSMALAKPSEMSERDFLKRAKTVQEWFTPLNPYAMKGPLFKIEKVNYRPKNGKLTKQLRPLFCWAISAKRYALFNTDRHRRPIIRKASAHGLGHLLPPTDDQSSLPPDMPEPTPILDMKELKRWQYGFWYRILQAALQNHPDQVNLEGLSFDQAAASRYAATSPALLRWFKKHNRRKSYGAQVKPFGFMYACQGRAGYLSDAKNPGRPDRRKSFKRPKVVAPYDRDLARALEKCFDRETSKSISIDRLESYRAVLAQYHMRPEYKFDNADFTDAGLTVRRYVVSTAIEHIGKEANRWEEQYYLGHEREARIIYGTSPDAFQLTLDSVILESQNHGLRKLAEASGLSVGEISTLRTGRGRPSLETLMKLIAGIEIVRSEKSEFDHQARTIIAAVRQRCQQISVREFARLAGIDNGNLIKVLNGSRRPTRTVLSRLESTLARIRQS
jgi:transcriptional regulator with XRE-family HTH domain